MANWIEPDIYSNYFNGEDGMIVYRDLQYIAQAFAGAGLGSVEILNCDMPQNLALNLVMDRFNLVEQNIDNLHEIADYPDIYYGSSFRWTESTDMRKFLYSGVKRWLKWLIDAKRHRDGNFETVYLTDKNGNQIMDQNGNKILAYKEW